MLDKQFLNNEVIPIISLTSHPARLPFIGPCLDSLIQQKGNFKKIILWLSYEEFPGHESSLPKAILEYKRFGISIEWCHNLKSYNKLIPALLNYPDDVIVIADDDVVYPKDWLERLVNAYKEFPDCVNALRVHKIAKYHGVVQEYKNWASCSEDDCEKSYLNFATGVGGVIYTKNLFYMDLFNESIFLRLCPTSDDIWFWAMAVMNNTKTRIIKPAYDNIVTIDGSQEVGLWKINNSKGENDVALKKLFMFYPEIRQKLHDNKSFLWFIDVLLKSYTTKIVQKIMFFVRCFFYPFKFVKKQFVKLNLRIDAKLCNK